MEKLIKSMIKSSFISSGLLIILGLLLFLRSDDTIAVISYIIGGTIIVIGMIAFIKYFRNKNKDIINSVDILYGVITVVFGAFILSNPNLIATVIPLIVGAWALIKSTIKITYAMELKNIDSPVWKPTLITSIMSALVGVLMIFNPFKTSVLVFKIIGAAIIVYAVIDIINAIELNKNINSFNSDNSDDVKTKRIETEEEITEASIEEIKDTNTKKKKKKDGEEESE